MPAFDRESLSPHRVAPELIDLPFGLTWQELSKALPGLLPDRVAECVLTRRYTLRGLCDQGGSTPATVRYPVAGGFETVDLFIKRTPAAAPEGHWYRLLAANHVAVPQLLAELPRGNGDVVIVLEFLESIGIDFDSAAEVTELLHLLARLNSIADSEMDNSRSGPGGLPEAQFTARVREALDALTHMRQFADLKIVVPRWLDAYFETKQACAKMPTALTHGEMYFQQVGRSGGGALVLFDLATLAVRPRFFDLCNIVSALAESTGVDERSLLGQYLDAIDALGVHVPTVDDAYHELRLLRITSAYQSLPWLVREHTNPDIGFEMLAQRVTTLRHDLSDLGVLA